MPPPEWQRHQTRLYRAGDGGRDGHHTTFIHHIDDVAFFNTALGRIGGVDLEEWPTGTRQMALESAVVGVEEFRVLLA